jgi:hypothetical protein
MNTLSIDNLSQDMNLVQFTNGDHKFVIRIIKKMF